LGPVVVKAIPRLTVSEPSIAAAAIAAAVAPFVVPTPFVELSLLVITKSLAITGIDNARQTKADVPDKIAFLIKKKWYGNVCSWLLGPQL
jgi:hypothetical protein